MNIASYIYALMLLAIIAALHFLGADLGWYLEYWWFDIIMHFLGGLWVALSAYWLFFESGIFSIKKERQSLALTIFLSVLAVGIAWEIFEYVTGLTFAASFQGYVSDTYTDIALDLVGGLVAFWRYRLKDPLSFKCQCR